MRGPDSCSQHRTEFSKLLVLFPSVLDPVGTEQVKVQDFFIYALR